ncbi:response regulator [Paenibacillus sp. HB172176]|uniref:response regulator n=1 Tax=Paenibacillus sp. HB172176 TaxID=2493690 RepID=UPI001439681C|nr:response regulator [Paenibacillus sp. HB172176]
MLHMLIVDDEVSVVETLAQSYPWEELGFGHVQTASSGAEALSYMEQHAVDVLITDIRMPELSGIELLERVRRRWPRTKAILLSGHAEFEYAQQAMTFQPIRYLLKPVSDEELLAAVSEAAGIVRRQWQEASSLAKAEQVMREHLPALRQMLLGELLLERISTGEFVGKAEEYGLSFREGESFYFFMLCKDAPSEHWNSSSLFDYAVGNIAGEVLEPAFEPIYGRNLRDELVFVLRAKDPDLINWSSDASVRYAEELVLKLQDCVTRYLKQSVSVVLGGIGTFPDGLLRLYKNCQTAIRQTVLRETGYVLHASGSNATLTEALSLTSLYEPPQFAHLLQSGRWQEAEEKLETLFVQYEADGSLLPEHATEIHFSIVAALIAACHLHGVRFAEMAEEDYEALLSSGRASQLQGMKNILITVLGRIRDAVNLEKKGTRSRVVSQVRQYIETHLDQDVSLQNLADQVFMHPVYLSQLYKAETGEGISDFLLRCRMEKSVFMLKEGKDKVQDISRSIGYQNTSYFIRVFKQYFGLTPQEYRESR